MFRIILYLALSVITYYASINWPYGFKYEDYKDYLSLITSISGMVFTIMGIWIAFLYPSAMNRILNPDKIVAVDFSESQSDTQRLESIVGAILASALVMIVVLLINLAKIIFFLTPIYIEYRLQFKAIALSTLIFITLVQLESVIHVVLSNVMFINDLHWKRQTRKANEEM